MKCAKVRELISADADGLVSPRVHEELSAHIAVCDSCKREYETTTRMLAEVSELGNRKAPVDMWPVVQVRIEDTEHARQGIFGRLLTPVLRPIIAVPAVAAIAAATFITVHTLKEPSRAPQQYARSSEVAAYYEEFSEFRSTQGFGDNSTVVAAQLEKPKGKE